MKPSPTAPEPFSESALIRWLHRNRRGLFAAAYGVFVFYASVLPFDMRWSVGRDRLVNLERILNSPDRTAGGSDVFVNILLYIPLAAGVCLAVRHRFQQWTVAMFAGCLCGIALSALVELLQLFSKSRVGSPVDIVTNTIGSAVGCMLSPAILLAARTMRRRRQRTMATQPLWHLAELAVGGLFVMSLMPFDVRTDLGEIRDGLKAARFRPFWQLWETGPDGLRLQSTADFWVEFSGEAGQFLLLGAVVAVAAVAEARAGALTALVVTLWTAAAVAAVVEIAQLFIASRGFDVTDLIAAAAGATAGGGFGIAVGATAKRRKWRWDGGTRLVGTAPLVLVLLGDVAYLAARGLAPFRFHSLPPDTRILSAIEWVPFRSYAAHLTPALVGNFFLKLGRFAVLGIILMLILRRDRTTFRRRLTLTAFAAGVFSAAIEFMQLAVASRYPDTSDVFIAVMGTLAGATGVQWYLDAVSNARRRQRREAIRMSARDFALPGTPRDPSAVRPHDGPSGPFGAGGRTATSPPIHPG